MPNQRVMTYKGLDSQVFEMDSNAKSSSVRTQLMTSGFIGEDSPTEAWRFFIYIVFYFFVFKSHEDAVKVIGQINAPNPSVWD